MTTLHPMLLTLNKIEKRISELERYRYTDHTDIPRYSFWVDREAPVGTFPPEDAEWGAISVGDRWEGRDVTAWLKATVTVPERWAGRTIVGLFDFGKTGSGHNSGFESLLFVDGVAYQGVDSNHVEVMLPADAAGRTFELLFKVWSGLNGNTGVRTKLEHNIRQSALALLEPDADDLYYTADAACRTVKVLSPDGFEHRRLLGALDRALALPDWREPGSGSFYASVRQANAALQSEIAAIPQVDDVIVRCIGHTHIDVAWLWRLKHTREKAARSFSTVLRLMEQFPEYVFLQTQPQLYEDLQRDYPEIYGRIEQKVKEGRWEAGGAMWLESDCNIPSGESLVRQLVYGQRYFERQFGARCEYLWLPDVFGYSWALPQILRKAGLKYFMTTKISWNVYNRFPHDTFYWRGIDGTEILTHFITTPPAKPHPHITSKFYTYNGEIFPETVMGIWRDYRDKEINHELLLSYGYGDGGGGPTRAMLEMRRRLERMPGLPKAVVGRADDYFRNMEKNVANTDRYVHKWDGELYLELHRGTYTSQAYNKKMNRRLEQLLHDAEMISAVSGSVKGFSDYPADPLYECWKIVLRNQFHDILPGSSIREVYEDCRVEYAEAERLGNDALESGLRALAMRIGSGGVPSELVFNTLPWPREELIEVEADEAGLGGWTDASGTPLPVQSVPGTRKQLVKVGVPAIGYATIQRRAGQETANQAVNQATNKAVNEAAERMGSERRGTDGVNENRHGTGGQDGERAEAVSPIVAEHFSVTTPYWIIEWNKAGQLTRIYDIMNGREVLAPGETGNRFDVHEDKPVAHDAWDIDIFYYDKTRTVTELASVDIVERGPLRGVVRFVWRYGKSEIRQRMTVYAHRPRIDFQTEVTWNEPQQLLKVAFPVHIRATRAVHEIQFGNVERPTHWNTSWDYARFETCAHRWVDLSERDYGVSLLNDCKYGHDIRDHVMRLTLIKAAVSPDAEADIGEHEFTYSLLPHAGDWFVGRTQIEAQCLNAPVRRMSVPDAGGLPGEAPRSVSFFRCENDHVVIDTIKKAEDADAWIVRCYEFGGKRGTAVFHCHDDIERLDIVDLMEREERTLACDAHSFTDEFTPYELKTYRVFVKGA